MFTSPFGKWSATCLNQLSTCEEPAEKKRKQLSIASFAVPIGDIPNEMVDEDEITITATIRCPPLKSKSKTSVGRPRKPVDMDLEEFHDFNNLLKESVRYEKVICKFFQVEDKNPTKTRLRYSVKKKIEIRKKYAECGNACETARAFNTE